MTARQIEFSKITGELHIGIAAFSAKLGDFNAVDVGLASSSWEPGFGKVRKVAIETSGNLQFVLASSDADGDATVYLIADVRLADKLDTILDELGVERSIVSYRVDEDPETLVRYREIFLHQDRPT